MTHRLELRRGLFLSFSYIPINQNLEAMAKQLYDYWFVQFDFPNEEGKPYKSSGGKMVWNEKLKREIPKDWKVTNIGNILGKVISTPRLSTNEYLADGIYPVIDQTTEVYYAGFTNRKEAVVGQYPAVVFGDHSCAVKYVNFPFVRGADGTQVMLSNNANISIEYLYFVVKNIKIGKGYARHYSFLKEQLIVFPSNVIAGKFEKITQNLMEQITRNRKENQELTKLRNELLPLLMNGQVSVNSDLAVSYIIYKDINIRIMKENIIQAIVAKMQRDLDCRQMAQLKAVLTSELHNVEIIEKEEYVYQQTQENEQFLNSFISAKKIEGCSDKTLAYYRNTIERLLVTLSMAICHITTSDIRTYLSDYQEEHQSSKVTIDNMRRIFSSFFAWLEDEDYIAKSPVRRIHKVKTDSLVKEVLSDEQLEQLRDSCTNKRDLAIIDFLSSTGIRVGELVKLNREDIDFHERQCVVFGKGNKERVVYFNARTKLHLQQYLNERTDDNPALFVSLNSPHSRLTISGVEVRIRKLGQSLSMSKVHPHKFRRTLATMAIDKGMPIEQVQRLLGHVRIDTTLHYAIVNQNNVKLAHKKYLG